MTMRRLLLIFLSAVFVFAADTIVTVNGRAITDDIVPGYSKLDKQKQELIKEQLINEELLMDYALKSGVVKDKRFKKVFEAQKAKIERVYKEKMKKGLSAEQIRNIKGSIAVQAMFVKKARSFKISDKEAKAFYEKNKSKFNMPKSVELATIATKDKKEVERILKKLKKSKDIPSAIMKIAKEKKQRGYLGWIPEDAFPKDVFKKIYSAKANSLLKEPIKVQDTYNIVYLVNKKKAGIAKYKEINKDILKMQIAKQKTNLWLKSKLEELRKKAIIK
jgi:foldase protein PrsA